MLNGTPDDLMLALARLIRCAMVASGTRKALAISAVVRPPTARSVRAMAEAGVSAGWQHMKSSISVSSPSTPISTSGGGTNAHSAHTWLATASSRRRRAISLRRWSVMRRRATWYSQPRGFCGMPCAGHCVAAATSASCTASSAASKSPCRRATAPSTCGARSRSRRAMSRSVETAITRL
jgi:hypothetical protein